MLGGVGLTVSLLMSAEEEFDADGDGVPDVDQRPSADG